MFSEPVRAFRASVVIFSTPPNFEKRIVGAETSKRARPEASAFTQTSSSPSIHEERKRAARPAVRMREEDLISMKVA